MYKYVLNLVIKISLMFAQYFEYYAIILRGAVFLWTQCIIPLIDSCVFACYIQKLFKYQSFCSAVFMVLVFISFSSNIYDCTFSACILQTF